VDEADGNGPSPAAAVTRFTDPFQTSPAPKTPAGSASAHFQIRIGNQPVLAPPAPGRAFGRSRRAVRLTLASPAQGRYALVWLTNSRRTYRARSAV